MIRESHLDTFGHVNNATYLQILEEARWEIMNKNGYGLETIRKTKLGPVILEVNLKFKRELTVRKRVVIRSQLKSYEGKIALFEQSILGEDGQVCATAVFTFALFNVVERKLVEPTPEWARAIGAILD